MLKMFKGVKNVVVTGETVTDEGAFKTARLEDYSAARWNDLARRTNTASFIRMTGREPKDYAEVQAWVKGLSAKPQRPTKKPDVEKLKKLLEYRKKADAPTPTF